MIRSFTSLDDLKTLLRLGPKIKPSVVYSVIRGIGSAPPDPTLEPPSKRQRALRVTHFNEEDHHTVQSVVIRPKRDVPKMREVVLPLQVHHPVPSPQLPEYSEDELGESPGITLGDEEDEGTVNADDMQLLYWAWVGALVSRMPHPARQTHYLPSPPS